MTGAMTGIVLLGLYRRTWFAAVTRGSRWVL